jgi:hypothetical protein
MFFSSGLIGPDVNNATNMTNSSPLTINVSPDPNLNSAFGGGALLFDNIEEAISVSAMQTSSALDLEIEGFYGASSYSNTMSVPELDTFEDWISAAYTLDLYT